MFFVIKGLVKMTHIFLRTRVWCCWCSYSCWSPHTPTHHHGTGQDDARVSSGQWSVILVCRVKSTLLEKTCNWYKFLASATIEVHLHLCTFAHVCLFILCVCLCDFVCLLGCAYLFVCSLVVHCIKIRLLYEPQFKLHSLEARYSRQWSPFTSRTVPLQYLKSASLRQASG